MNEIVQSAAHQDYVMTGRFDPRDADPDTDPNEEPPCDDSGNGGDEGTDTPGSDQPADDPPDADSAPVTAWEDPPEPWAR